MRTARRLTLQVGQELQRQQEERRLGAVYETEAVRQADGRVVPRTVRPTYIPFRGNVETFGQLVYLEAARRGLEDAGEVIILGDGAEMRYDEYRASGYQIGNGTVESACKGVIGRRLKQAGMIGSERQAMAVASIRAALLDGQWDGFWQTRSFSPKRRPVKAA